MLPFLKNPKHRLILASVVILGFIAIRLYAGALSPLRGGMMPVPQETEVARPDSKIKITATTDLVQKIVYLKCNDEETFRTKPADNLVGLNLSQVQKVYEGWTIDKFDNQEVVMNLKVDSFCREHANNTFIGVKDGHVAVYYGKPGPRAILKEMTQIPLTRLSAQDADEIKRGLAVQSREELLRTLEGLQSQ